MRELFAQESAAIGKVEELSKQLGVTEAATKRFFAILGEQQVPVEALPERLVEIATRHKDLLARVERSVSSDPRIQARKEEARAAIEAGQYDRAERLLNEAKEAAIGAARRLKEEAAEAAAENGALAMTQLRYREAVDYFAEAVDLLPEGSDEGRAYYLNQQGEAAWRGGNYRMAVQAHRTALDIRERIYTPNDHRIAYGLNQLALALQDTGRFTEAEPLLKRALAIDEKTLGSEHPSLAIELNNLALVYKDTGRSAEAEPLLKRALAIDEKALGPEHPSVGASLNTLAGLYHAQGRSAEAEPLYERALAIFKASLGEGHPSTQTVQQNLNALVGSGQTPQTVVVRVLPNSQAAQIGLQSGDIIESYDGERIVQLLSFVTAVRQPGESPRELIILRDGQTLQFRVAPGLLGVELRERAAPAGAAAEAPREPSAEERR